MEKFVSENLSTIERYLYNGGINKLGGVFLCGKPLPHSVRERIVEMSKHGMRHSVISKKLRVSHSCVSRILDRYHKTGSLHPENFGGPKSKIATPKVIDAIANYRKTDPKMFAKNIRLQLLADGICNFSNVPSISTIRRIIRNFYNNKNLFKPLEIKSAEIPFLIETFTFKSDNLQDNYIETSNKYDESITLYY